MKVSLIDQIESASCKNCGSPDLDFYNAVSGARFDYKCLECSYFSLLEMETDLTPGKIAGELANRCKKYKSITENLDSYVLRTPDSKQLSRLKEEVVALALTKLGAGLIDRDGQIFVVHPSGYSNFVGLSWKNALTNIKMIRVDKPSTPIAYREEGITRKGY
jgi:hypothetical protein